MRLFSGELGTMNLVFLKNLATGLLSKAIFSTKKTRKHSYWFSWHCIFFWNKISRSTCAFCRAFNHILWFCSVAAIFFLCLLWSCIYLFTCTSQLKNIIFCFIRHLLKFTHLSSNVVKSDFSSIQTLKLAIKTQTWVHNHPTTFQLKLYTVTIWAKRLRFSLSTSSLPPFFFSLFFS